MSDHVATAPQSTPHGQTETLPFWWAVGRRGVLASAILGLLYLASISWLQLYPRDIQNYVIGRDFLNFWTMGREALSENPGRFYDWRIYNGDYLRPLLGPDYPYQQWSYPPHLMLLAIPFGQLPYLIAYGLWTGLGLAALYQAARPWLADRRAAAIVFLSPAALLCFVSGQNGFFTATALIMIYRWRDERPVLAGIVLGLLTIKPQLGLLFPLVLLLSRRWTLFAAAGATATTLIAVTIGVFGLEPFAAYIDLAVPIQKSVITDPTPIIQSLMPTVYMSLRQAGLSSEIGFIVQVSVLLLGAGLVAWAFFRRRDPLLSYALLLTATALATPYLMSYDLVVFGWLFLALAGSVDRDRFGRWLLGALYWLPFLTLALGAAGIPGAALVLAGLAVWLGVRLSGRPVQKTSGPAVAQPS